MAKTLKVEITVREDDGRTVVKTLEAKKWKNGASMSNKFAPWLSPTEPIQTGRPELAEEGSRFKHGQLEWRQGVGWQARCWENESDRVSDLK